ncbi:amyloid beta A4 precursor protein-binding family B member 1-interacting protein-like isoform X2 [Gouania willdenowi]|uniref:Amyloid beta A4 precursor protein-binding family B member 1-interacting protein n=1 Tax=Gouania willdenowi TaxID=441366 RepID=A0A8C5ETR0_GOUWI|nr:amyloid beta A4 precursor protein-binding family B member 1-interacting protein-like isoform X2 [Gouania willdenowi]
MDDLDVRLDDLLGEINDFTLAQTPEANAAQLDSANQGEKTFSIGFTDLNEFLRELEEQDLDALVDDLRSDLPQKDVSTPDQSSTNTDPQTETALIQDSVTAAPLPPPPSPNTQESCSWITANVSEPQTKAEKIKLALEKLKEAKVRKLIVKVLICDGGSKALMVDERQTVRDVLDKLFEKTHCDCNINWSLCEINPELQIERTFEDHEYLVEPLSIWTRNSENKIYFTPNHQKYVMFREPQLFYLWKKKNPCLNRVNKKIKELLIEEHLCGSTLMVPDLEGVLFLKEDGKKVWKPRYFVLRASGIYYVPKGKTKSSSDLACYVRYGNVNVHTAHTYKEKYRAPTDFCFILKHPHIQKESNYIRFLCCADEHGLMLWVNSIRIAKYGAALYKNYQAALKRESSLTTKRVTVDQSNGLTYDSTHSRSHPTPTGTNSDDVDYPHEPPPDFIPPPPPPLSP